MSRKHTIIMKEFSSRENATIIYHTNYIVGRLSLSMSTTETPEGGATLLVSTYWYRSGERHRN